MSPFVVCNPRPAKKRASGGFLKNPRCKHHLSFLHPHESLIAKSAYYTLSIFWRTPNHAPQIFYWHRRFLQTDLEKLPPQFPLRTLKPFLSRVMRAFFIRITICFFKHRAIVHKRRVPLPRIFSVQRLFHQRHYLIVAHRNFSSRPARVTSTRHSHILKNVRMSCG